MAIRINEWQCPCGHINRLTAHSCAKCKTLNPYGALSPDVLIPDSNSGTIVIRETKDKK